MLPIKQMTDKVMNKPQLSHGRSTLLLAGLFSMVVGLSACQKQPEPPVVDASAAEKDDAPMSADPAEPSVNPEIASSDNEQDPSMEVVAEQTVANVGTSGAQMRYACTPELTINATYHDADGKVSLSTDKGDITLTSLNQDASPTMFEIKQTMDGGQGVTQWRVAHSDRETGVLRTSLAGDDDISTYECKMVSEQSAAQ